MTPRFLLLAILAGLPLFSKAERSLYLHTLDLDKFVAGWNKTTSNQTPDKKPLQIGKQNFAQGIWTHAPSTARLVLPPDALFLSATVGVQNQGNNLGTIRFMVKAEDNSILFDSGLMKSDTPPRDLEVSLAGHKVVLLVTDPGPDGNVNDNAVWAQARLIVEGSATQPPYFARNDTLTPDLTSLQIPVESASEGLLLGNGLLGASLWGDARTLRFSLDLAGLWSPGTASATPSLIGLNPATAKNTLSQTGPDPANGPRRLPLGRFELKHNFANSTGYLSLNHNTETAVANLLGSTNTVNVSAFIPAGEPVLIVNSGSNEFQPTLLPPVVAVKLGLPEPEKGTEDLPEGKLSWFSLATSPKPTFVASLHRPKVDKLPHLYLVTAEMAETVAAARDIVLARLRKIAAEDPKNTVKAHTEWWKKHLEDSRVVPGDAEWQVRMRLARHLLGSSARGSGEPGGWLWTFEESDPARLPAALATGYPANAALFAASRLGFAETAESQARWHLDRLASYRAQARKNFGTEGIVVPGLLLPDGSPAALATAALAPGLSAQAGWPFLLAARLNPGSPLARGSSLAWLEDSSRALAIIAGGEAAKKPALPWGVAPGSPGGTAATSWHDAFLLRTAFAGSGELSRLLGGGASAKRWTELAERVALPASASETSPGVPWTSPSVRPSHLLGYHPLRFSGLAPFTLPAPDATAPASTRLWLACAASRTQPEAALALAASVPLGRNGLPLAATAEPGGPQGLLAQTLELIENLCLLENADGSAEVFPAVPKAWPTATIKGLPLANGARIGAEWAAESIREISVSSERDIEVALVDSFGTKGFRTSHKAYHRASGKIIVTLKAGETAILRAP